MAAMNEHDKASGMQRQRRAKNLALAAVLAAFVVLVYLVSIVRMGGG
jgi:ferric-dicitrate binding protein FerR (iron transport regulator)